MYTLNILQKYYGFKHAYFQRSCQGIQNHMSLIKILSKVLGVYKIIKRF